MSPSISVRRRRHGKDGAVVSAYLRFATVASLAFPALMMTTMSPTAANSPSISPGVDDPMSFIEELFRAARYDSLLRVIDAFEKGALETHDSLLAGRMVVQRGRVQLMTGHFAESLRSIDAGIQTAQAVRDTSGWMPALTFRGYALVGLGRFDEAMECYQMRLFLGRRVHSSLNEAWALTNIAYVLHLRGDQTNARDDYTRAMHLFREGGRTDLEVTPLIGLGRVNSALGNDADAIRCYQRAWIVARDIGDRENEMWAANNLGALESEHGDMTRAIQYAQRAYQIARDMGYPRGAVMPAINIASWRMELGEYARAEAILKDAAAVCAQSGSPEFGPTIDFHLARLALNRGQYHFAASAFRRLLAGGRLEPQHRDFARVGLASALAFSDSVAAAIEILLERLTPGYQWYSDSGTAARLLLSELQLRVGRPAAALEQATRCREEAERRDWRQTAVSARLHETECYRALDRGEDALASLHAALDGLESLRGGQSEPEWREVYGQSESAGVLAACRACLDYPASTPREQRERAFYDALQQFKTRTLLERISAPRSSGAATAVSAEPVTLRRLQSDVLAPDELLLDIVTGNSESVMFAVTADSMRVVFLADTRAALREKVALYRAVISDPSPSSQASYGPAQLRAMQSALGRAILGGVADLLSRYRRILVSPDAYYASIPFGTLIVSFDRGGSGGKMLMEDHDLVRLHSAGALAFSRVGSRPADDRPMRICVVLPPGGRTLPGATDEARALDRGYRGVEIEHGLADGPRGLESLGARFDALHIAAHARVNDESPWNSGFNLDANDAGPSRAAHGEPAPDVGRILSREDSIVVASTFREDHWLRAWQIARSSLPFQMAVLAGCETAGGRATSGEGVLGLTAAFSSAGVPIVVSSLWPVDDHSTALVMTAFYSHLAAGTPVADALRHAQMEVRGSGDGIHPFYWAGFTVVGDGTRVLRLQPSYPFRPPAAGLVLASALMAAAVLLWRRTSKFRAA